MSCLRLIHLLSAALASGLCGVASGAQLSMQIDLGPAATGKDWYQMALWLEDPQGRYAQTLYVTADVGREGLGNGFWRVFGLTLREAPESLPVWAHRRGVRYGKSYYPPKERPLPDALTGATIKQTRILSSFELAPEVARRLGADPWRCLLELNVSRDGIASVVFQALAVPDRGPAPLRFVGHGDRKGRDGALHGGEADPGAFVTGASCRITQGRSAGPVR